MSSLSTSLKNSYDRWLNPYENYLRQAKPGVYQQLEYEYGGPLTPSPAPSPIKRSSVNTPSSLRGESPARHATDALQVGLGVSKSEGDRDSATAADLPSLIPQPTSGFTAINSGGFTAVNAGFTSVNRPTPPEAKSFTPPPKRHDSPASLAKDTALDIRPSSLSSANVLKRQLSFDSIDSARKEASADKDDSESGSRRSKRLKKGMLHLILVRLATRLPLSSFSPFQSSIQGTLPRRCGRSMSFLLIYAHVDSMQRVHFGYTTYLWSESSQSIAR